MNPARWRLIEAVFAEAADLSFQDRASFLERACGDDRDLRREVDALLAHDGNDDAIRHAVDAVADLVSRDYSARDAEGRVGQRVGPYKVTGLIGHGGMGAVYRAIRADDQFQKTVAIKLVKRGLDSAEVVARFRRERQILAALEHPNIARLLDGGAQSDGSPYFVMEHVDDGLPITEYCARLKLDVEERLRLFLLVCEAVRHAHRNLVIHRDLKPRNILVDKEGSPKLLDFGIAKLLHAESNPEDDAQTRTGVRLLTPDYASPEQVRGDAVTTATDVYSLGAVLFELLSGRRAHVFRDYSDAEIARVVCLSEQEKPSALVKRSHTMDGKQRRQLERTLSGDLDAIVLKAMRKEPEHRYGSVEQLSADIERYLSGRPVRARKGTWRYRAGKFLARHRLAAVAVMLVGASLIAGAATTVWQARKAGEQARVAQIEAARAERRFRQVRRLSRTVLFDLDGQIQELPGATAARESLVKLALEYLDSLAAEAGGDPQLQWELAEAYEKVAQVQGSPNAPNLGHSAAAIASFGKAIEILGDLYRRDPGDPRVVKSLYQAWNQLGHVQAHVGSARESLASFRKSAEFGLLYAAMSPGDPVARQIPGKAQAALADTARRLGDLPAALEGFRKALALDEQWLAAAPGNPDAQRAVAACHSRLGKTWQETGDLERAAFHSRMALEMVEKAASRKDAPMRDLDKLALAYQRMGDLYAHPRMANLGDPARARGYYARKHDIYSRMVAADPRDAQARIELSYSYLELATSWMRDNPAKAESLYRRALALGEEAARREPDSAAALNFLGQVRSGLGRAVFEQGRRSEGLALSSTAVEVLERSASRKGGPAVHWRILEDARASLAALRARRGGSLPGSSIASSNPIKGASE